MFLVAFVFVDNNSNSTRGNSRFVSDSVSVSEYRSAEVSFEQHRFRVLVADDESKRALGLGLLENLDEWGGMLFVFEKPAKHSFWMKGMNFPIDIFWLDQDGVIVFIQENAHPDDYPKMYQPDKNALYVLELTAGSSSQFNIQVGNQFGLSI